MHFATRTNDHIHSWTNLKHLKIPNCKLGDKKEDIIHLFITCKRSKKIWKHFQKYYQCLTQKEHTPIQHILIHSANTLLSETKKLVLILTITILIHIWKTRNRLQFDETIIPTTNTILNIKNDLKSIIQTHYKQHNITNTIPDFERNFCVNNFERNFRINNFAQLNKTH